MGPVLWPTICQSKQVTDLLILHKGLYECKLFWGPTYYISYDKMHMLVGHTGSKSVILNQNRDVRHYYALIRRSDFNNERVNVRFVFHLWTSEWLVRLILAIMTEMQMQSARGSFIWYSPLMLKRMIRHAFHAYI